MARVQGIDVDHPQEFNFDFKHSLEFITKPCSHDCFQETHRKQAQSALDTWRVSFFFSLYDDNDMLNQIFCLGGTLDLRVQVMS